MILNSFLQEQNIIKYNRGRRNQPRLYVYLEVHNMKMTDTEFDKSFKIAGTKYDRHCKVTPTMAADFKRMLANKKTYKEIQRKYNLSYCAIRYAIDEEFARYMRARVSGKHTGVTTCDFANRVSYKKSLIRGLEND